MTTSSNLNYEGQAGLAAIGSVVMNAAVHPLCTIKNKWMARKPNEKLFPSSYGTLRRLKSLYLGYKEICLTESAFFVVSYVVNGWLKSQDVNQLASSILAGICSAPVVMIGEGLMINNQVNEKAFSREVLRSSMKASGLMATILREVPYTVAIFTLAPMIESKMPVSGLAGQSLAGVISGSLCGALTAPADKIKTLVQANDTSFMDASRSVKKEVLNAHGRRGLLKDAGIRAVYIGLSVAIMNVINNQLPPYFPNRMRE